VLRAEFIDYVICGLREELQQRHEVLDADLKAIGEEKHRIEAELKRLVESIAMGNASPTVMAAIAEREARIRPITHKLIEPGPDSLQEKLDDLRALAVSGLARLRDLLANPSEIHEARAFLAERVGKFTLHRVQSNGRFSFQADGKMDFFGDLHVWMVPGDGIGPNVCP
jgi:hypothetical protein